MPILILGLVFVIGLFIYYLATTTVDNQEDDFDDENLQDNEEEKYKKDENVIFLPNDIERMKEKYKKNK